ncbi:uncharacterized protein N7529_004187 [Penicillium soppii]|uniref:uncharacterized protein n=1 Tax=Penicillium soppii TaxID=69789 RepID=UPI0025487CD7|nr:uncharacterized protein N7529_004187 [Penicillium soppii]KAJ5871834.1 hypothetical protein N7529_004187 [Penicillium soppii]
MPERTSQGSQAICSSSFQFFTSGSRATMFTRTLPQLSRFRFIYRDNRVPYYQKLFQTNDSKRMWWKVSIWAKTPKNSVPFGYRAFTHGQFFNNRPTEVAGLCGPI